MTRNWAYREELGVPAKTTKQLRAEVRLAKERDRRARGNVSTKPPRRKKRAKSPYLTPGAVALAKSLDRRFREVCAGE